MFMHELTVILTILLTLLLLPLHSLSLPTHHLNRRLLHHPLILPPLATTPSPSPTPLPHPNHHPTHPFSTSTPTLTTPSTTPTTPTTQTPFFPTDPTLSPPPPPQQQQPSLPPPSSPVPTFPANISSLALPSTHSPSSHTSPLSLKLTLLITLLSLLSLSLLLTLCFLLKNKHHHKTTQDPPSKITPQPKPNPKTSSEFLYLGTLSHSDHHNTIEHPQTQSSPSSPPPMYLKLCGGSPELKPLPPLPKQHFSSGFQEKNKLSFDNDEEFFSPKGFHRNYDHRDDIEEENYGLNSCETSEDGRSSVDSDVSVEIRELAAKKTEVVKTEHFPVTGKVAPPPPPPPPGGSRKVMGGGFVGPPPLVPPSGVTGFRRSGERPRSGGIGGGGGERVEEVVNGIGKTKLKALHWDKVRASSDRVMVWDQLHPGSFQ